MVYRRAEKVARVANSLPPTRIDGTESGDVLVIGWGGTYGSLHSAVKKLNFAGFKVGHAHFNYINPMPKNTAEIFSKFKKIIVCELNSGQFAFVLKGKFDQFKFLQINKVMGLPFSVTVLVEKFKNIIKES